MGSAARSVTLTGMVRSTPSQSWTTKHLPERVVAVSTMGKVEPYSGCLGSMTVIVSAARPVATGVVGWVWFTAAGRSRDVQIVTGADPVAGGEGRHL